MLFYLLVHYKYTKIEPECLYELTNSLFIRINGFDANNLFVIFAF